jgi:hypothetical protein
LAEDGNVGALKEILSRTEPTVRRVAVEGVAADFGNAMLRKMLDRGVFPTREGYALPLIGEPVIESEIVEDVAFEKGEGRSEPAPPFGST